MEDNTPIPSAYDNDNIDRGDLPFLGEKRKIRPRLLCYYLSSPLLSWQLA